MRKKKLAFKDNKGNLQHLKVSKTKWPLKLWKVDVCFFRDHPNGNWSPQSNLRRPAFFSPKPLNYFTPRDQTKNYTSIVVRCRRGDDIYDIVAKYIAEHYIDNLPYCGEIIEWEQIILTKEKP